MYDETGKEIQMSGDMGVNSEKKHFKGNIFLIGFMGTGKSTVARAFARYHGMDIIEMDEMIEERHAMSIADIFKQRGEEFFRQEETGLLREIRDKNNKIVSCGGGVPLREENVEEMKKSGKVVLLTATPQTILERVKDGNNRPLLENNKRLEAIAELLQQRKEAYERAADIVVSTEKKTVREICQEVMEKIEREG